MYVYGGLAVGEETLLGLGAPVYYCCQLRDIPLIQTYYHYPSIELCRNIINYIILKVHPNLPSISTTYIYFNAMTMRRMLLNLLSTPPDRALEYGLLFW